MSTNNRTLKYFIHFDFAKLELTETNARELGILLSQVNGDELEGKQERVLCDRAYTYLRSAVEEVRAYGKYVFRSSPRLHGYQSDYNHQKNARRNPEPEE